MKNNPRRSFWRAAGPLLGFYGGSIFQDDTKWRSS